MYSGVHNKGVGGGGGGVGGRMLIDRGVRKLGKISLKKTITSKDKYSSMFMAP